MKNKLFMLMLVLVIGVLAACGTKDSGSNADSGNEGNKEGFSNGYISGLQTIRICRLSKR